MVRFLEKMETLANEWRVRYVLVRGNCLQNWILNYYKDKLENSLAIRPILYIIYANFVYD